MDSEEDIRARPLGAERHGGGLGMRMELILSFCGSLSLSLSLFHNSCVGGAIKVMRINGAYLGMS